MAVQLTVKYWRDNEPKLVKHTDWEKDVSQLLASWESSKKNVEAKAGDMDFYYKKLADWGAALKHALQVKHDWLNRVTHGESRKRIEEMMGMLDVQMKAYDAEHKAYSMVKEGQESVQPRTPNTGRPLPMRPPGRGAL